MKTCLPALVTLLNSSNVFQVIDLYQFTLIDGTILRYTSGEAPIVYNTFTWLSTVGFTRDGVKTTALPEVQTMTVTMMVDGTVLYGTVPFQRPLSVAIADGLFDGARLKLLRAFFNTVTGALVDAPVHFEGVVGQVMPTANSIQLSVSSEIDWLSQSLPRNLFSPQCQHAFLDAGCDPSGTLRTASTFTGALTGSQTAIVLQKSGNHAANFFKLGVIKLTSGINAGLRRAIRSDVDSGGNHLLTVNVPFPAAPAAADTYSLTKGCDLSFAACAAYANTSNYRGFPYVPRPEDGL